MSTPDRGRLMYAICEAADMNVPGMMAELKKIPGVVYKLRQQAAPLKTERAMLQTRFESGKNKSTSLFDLARASLLARLKEKARKNAPEGKRISDDRAGDLAHLDPEYEAFIQEARDQQIRIADLSSKLDDIYNQIEGWQTKREHIVNLLGVFKSVAYAYGEEAKLG